MVNYSPNALCWIIFANICIFSSNILFRTRALLFINKTDLYFQWGFQVVLVVKNLPANAGDSREVRSIPGLGRSPGEGNGNLLQSSCLENPMDRGAQSATVNGVAKELERLSTQSHIHLTWLPTWKGFCQDLWASSSAALHVWAAWGLSP